MLQTKDMDIEERLNHVRSLFHETVKQEEKRSLEKKMMKRKRQGSGTSITSTNSSASSNVKVISPPNKKLRALGVSSEPEINTDNQPIDVLGPELATNNDEVTSLSTSLPLKKRGKFFRYLISE